MLFAILAYLLRHDYHVIVGTHREIVAFYLLGLIKTTSLKIAVFDDADITATTNFTKEHIINKLPPSCQKVFTSSFKMVPNLTSNLVELRLLHDDNLFPHSNIDNFYVDCNTSQKYEIIKALCSEANKQNNYGKIVIFFTVSFKCYLVKTILN